VLKITTKAEKALYNNDLHVLWMFTLSPQCSIIYMLILLM